MSFIRRFALGNLLATRPVKKSAIAAKANPVISQIHRLDLECELSLGLATDGAELRPGWALNPTIRGLVRWLIDSSHLPASGVPLPQVCGTSSVPQCLHLRASL